MKKRTFYFLIGTSEYSVTFKMAASQSTAAPPSVVQRAWKPQQPIRKITGVCVCKYTQTNDYNQLQTNRISAKSQQSKTKRFQNKFHNTFLVCCYGAAQCSFLSCLFFFFLNNIAIWLLKCSEVFLAHCYVVTKMLRADP